jgi:alpha-L-fucosidase
MVRMPTQTLPSIAPTLGDTSWFVHDRFGLFIHWGLYALPARHEWVKNRERITDEAYQKYFDHFDPDLYDPAAWARTANQAGMKYAVITTKHHEGFCLWDSALTAYKAPNTPAGRDLLRPWVDAFRAEGLRIGFYHSLIDWHHPDFPVDAFHPQRDDEAFKAASATRDIRKYAAYLHGQVRELLTQFGPIDILWLDFSYPWGEWGGKGRDDWQSAKLHALIRELQPHIILNDRLDLPDARDIATPEQWQPRGWVTSDGQPVVWEACHTLNGSWGYDRDNRAWKSPEMLVKLLIDSVAKGGNLLLNVGPTARGEFDPRARHTLAAIGDWMRVHARAITGATMSAFTPPLDGRYTQRGDRLYLHLFSWPYAHVHLDGLRGSVAYAQLLHDGSEVKFASGDDPYARVSDLVAARRAETQTLSLELPVQKPDVLVPVIELFLR